MWFRVQREAWDEGISFGMTALRGIGNALVASAELAGQPAHPLQRRRDAGDGLRLGEGAAARRPCSTYCFVVLALMLMPSTVTARPRFLYTAFPLLIGVAAWWPERWKQRGTGCMAACGAGLVLLPVLYGGFAAIP